MLTYNQQSSFKKKGNQWDIYCKQAKEKQQRLIILSIKYSFGKISNFQDITHNRRQTKQILKKCNTFTQGKAFKNNCDSFINNRKLMQNLPDQTRNFDI